jgi:hypothetical protein
MSVHDPLPGTTEFFRNLLGAAPRIFRLFQQSVKPALKTSWLSQR